jgi:hypothetical protein
MTMIFMVSPFATGAFYGGQIWNGPALLASPPSADPVGFTTSGESAQDNDLIVIRDAGAAAKFETHFERMWDAAEPTDEFEPAIRALEPK